MTAIKRIRLHLSSALAVLTAACVAPTYLAPDGGARARVAFYLTASSSRMYTHPFPPADEIFAFTDTSCANRSEIRQAKDSAREKPGWKKPPYEKVLYGRTDVQAGTPFTFMFVSHGCGPSVTFLPVAGASYEVTYTAGNRCNVSVARVVEGQGAIHEPAQRNSKSCFSIWDAIP